jgi:hypothetical protein
LSCTINKKVKKTVQFLKFSFLICTKISCLNQFQHCGQNARPIFWGCEIFEEIHAWIASSDWLDEQGTHAADDVGALLLLAGCTTEHYVRTIRLTFFCDRSDPTYKKVMTLDPEGSKEK